ncbi:response regulator transcription factor [Chitinophaga arvensicola]|uniref:DNA-binding response regulator, OmpR family, contains REC and winged-helix (WHTH) domain n=1 Tax=Chitinophaga arvensicola TaxID=29529 RepID=A0A1I0PSG6_9BACT|nr:response regulator transcription factor [Chitinophaga arvensicola]SEW17326.1 DNA-binding response regulator, OmpR family, contains REC and winged-helix (wHTH) domain [Chitinophaga arvensicola]
MTILENAPEAFHILYAENDEVLVKAIKRALEQNGNFIVYCAYDGNEGWELYKRKSYDLCLLDVHMPGLDGVQLGGKIRAGNDKIPIIYLSADLKLETKLKGFKRGGADDYCEKPIQTEVLIYKMYALIKRSKEQNAVWESVSFGAFTYNRKKYTLSYGGKTYQLGIKEVKIMDLLTEKFNVTIPAIDLQTLVGGEGSKHSLNTPIANLRKHFKISPEVKLDTIQLTGYSLRVPTHLIKYHLHQVSIPY